MTNKREFTVRAPNDTASAIDVVDKFAQQIWVLSNVKRDPRGGMILELTEYEDDGVDTMLEGD